MYVIYILYILYVVIILIIPNLTIVNRTVDYKAFDETGLTGISIYNIDLIIYVKCV